jgi:mRNA-degrading endonuclease RelE of RelBE toxin-antitoxin system
MLPALVTICYGSLIFYSKMPFFIENRVNILYSISVCWNVRIHKQAEKRARKLPANVRILFGTLLRDLSLDGPIQPEWPNYSKLTHGRYHCHLNYSFVTVWEVVDKEIRILEVTYVGSREDAPY